MRQAFMVIEGTGIAVHWVESVTKTRDGCCNVTFTSGHTVKVHATVETVTGRLAALARAS